MNKKSFLSETWEMCTKQKILQNLSENRSVLNVKKKNLLNSSQLSKNVFFLIDKCINLITGDSGLVQIFYFVFCSIV